MNSHKICLAKLSVFIVFKKGGAEKAPPYLKGLNNLFAKNCRPKNSRSKIILWQNKFSVKKSWWKTLLANKVIRKFFCPALTKLALNLYVEKCMCVCVFVLCIVKTQHNSTQLNSTQSNSKATLLRLDTVVTCNPPTSTNFSATSGSARKLEFCSDTH